MNRDKEIKESYKLRLRGVAQHVIQEYLSTEKPMIDLVVHCIEQQRKGYEQKP